MRHARPDFEFDLASRPAHPLGHSHRVVAQDLVAADLNQSWRQAAGIAIERRDIGIAGIGAAEILRRKVHQIGFVEDRIGNRVAAARFAGDRQISPRR